MRWTDLPADDRRAVVVLLRSFATSKADEIARWKKHPNARELREWTAQRQALVTALRAAASALEAAKRRPGR